MKPRLAILLALAVATGWGQVRRPFPSRFASRGLRGAVAAGSENATEAGMRMFLAGGNAVDAGIATMLAAAVVEFSHFGLGGEAPILVRTKEGKVFAIAGVGTMPKLGTADFYRKHTLTPLEIDDPPGPNGLKDWVPVVGILSALVPGMVDAAIVTVRDFGTKSFAEVLQPAIELADGFPIDEFRAISLANSERYLAAWPSSKRVFLPNGAPSQARQHFPPAGPGAHPALHGRRGEAKPWPPAPRAPQAMDAVRDYFYRGDIARRIGEFSKQNGGLLRYEDMAAFRVEPEEAVSTTFHGYTVYKPGFWSQGPSMIEALNILEGFPIGQMRAEFGRLHPHHGGSHEAGLRRPRHLLWRPEFQPHPRRCPALQGIRRRAAQADHQRGVARIPAGEDRRQSAATPVAGARSSTTNWTRRCSPRTPPAWTRSIATEWRSRLRLRGRGCRR